MLHDFPIIIVDENLDARIVRSIIQFGYIVYSISDEKSGITDFEVIDIAIEKADLLLPRIKILAIL